MKQLEVALPLILCKLERIFPPGFFDSMEHLPVHLCHEAILGGPVQYRWMYPFERFLNKIKKTVKNKAHPEGSICEAYLLQETVNFCSYYFEQQDLQAVDGSTSPQVLSVFQTIAEVSGRPKNRYLNDKELQCAHLYVLLNCDEVQPYIDTFVGTLDTDDENLISKSIENDFFVWFRAYVNNGTTVIADQSLIALAQGPNRYVTIWQICDVNGFRFHTSSLSERRKTYNCGVCVKGNAESDADISYYGILQEVVHLSYMGADEHSVYLFNCEWFDPVLNRGTRKLEPYDIVEVKMNRKYKKFDPFILANQAYQVFYLTYPGRIKDKVDWAVVVRNKPRKTIEFETSAEPIYQSDHMTFFHSEVEVNDPEIIALHDALGESQLVSMRTVETEDEEDVNEQLLTSLTNETSDEND